MKKISLLFVLFVFIASAGADTYYVKITGTDAWTGKPAANIIEIPANGLQQELGRTVRQNHTFWVATGLYQIPVQMTVGAGQVIIGGFSGTESDVSERAKEDADGNGTVEPWEFKYPTIVQPKDVTTPGAERALLFNSSSNNTLLDGFTFENFHHTADNTSIIFLNNSTCKIQNVILRNSSLKYSTSLSGVFRVTLGTAVNCLVEFCSLEITGTTTNLAQGAFHVNGTNNVGSGIAIGCVSRGNIVFSSEKPDNGRGGGFALNSGTTAGNATIINCVAYNNYSSGLGGGIVVNKSTDKVINCTVVNNVSGNNKGAGIYMNAPGTVYNTVSWGNSGSSALSSDISVTKYDNYSLNNLAFGIFTKEGTGWGDDNIHFPGFTNKIYTTVPTGYQQSERPSNTTDNLLSDPVQHAPLFEAPTSFHGRSNSGSNFAPTQEDSIAIRSSNWKLQDYSPLVNAGDSSYITELKDLLGNDRIYGSSVDIGAFENSFYTGMMINASDNSFQIIRNKDIFSITGIDSNFSIDIFDISGKVVSSKAIIQNNSFFLPNRGVYLVRISNESFSKTVKIIF